LSNFYSKVVAHDDINKDKVVLYTMLTYIIFPIFYFVFHGLYIPLSFVILALVAVRVIIATEKNLCIIEGMKHMDASLFFPLHKIIHIFMSFLVGMVLF